MTWITRHVINLLTHRCLTHSTMTLEDTGRSNKDVQCDNIMKLHLVCKGNLVPGIISLVVPWNLKVESLSQIATDKKSGFIPAHKLHNRSSIFLSFVTWFWWLVPTGVCDPCFQVLTSNGLCLLGPRRGNSTQGGIPVTISLYIANL